MLNQILLKKYIHEKTNDLIIIRMFLAFGVSIFIAVPALFLKSHGFSDSYIGLIMGGVSLISLIISITSTIILEKINEYKIFLFSIFIPLALLSTLVFYPSIYIFILFLIVSAIFRTLRQNSFSIIFKDTAKNETYTQKQGLAYSLTNIGWFVGPFIGGLVLDNFGFVETFGLSAIFFFIALTISLMTSIRLKNKSRKTIDSNIIKNIKFYFKQKELIYSYFLAFSSSIWYVLIFTFMPLFLIGAGLSVVWVGIFIAATQLPLIFIQFKLNWFVKNIGMRKIMIYSFFYLMLVSLILFFYSEVYFAMIILMTTSFAIAFIEPLKEIYFFKNVTALEEEKTYPIFHTSFSTGEIFGKLLFAGVLLILPNSFLYLTMSLLMGLTMLMTFKLKNYNN
jgi:MFS family permease